MHPVHMNYGPRYIGAAILAVGIVGLAVLCRIQIRRNRHRGLLMVVYGYNALLFALFILGLLADDGYGVAFLPVLACTLPWSFFAPDVVQGATGNWFASGLIGNFVLIVVLCGGANSLLLYLTVRKIFYPAESSVAGRTLL
jgi:hypothetical protein